MSLQDIGALANSQATQQITNATDDAPDDASEVKSWLDETLWPDKQLATHFKRQWEQRDPEFRPRLIRWDINDRRRRGDRWVGLIKNPDRNEWRIYTPPGGAKTPPTLGKAARLCRRLTSQMFQDQPTPEAIPATDSDEDRLSAEFSTRVLTALSSEAGVNSTRTARIAFNKSHTYGSGFRYWWVDPHGDLVPKRLMAHPDALNPHFPTEAGDPHAIETMDPTSGPAPSGPASPVAMQMRMVTPPDEQGAQQFTDDPQQADQMWIPKLRCTVTTGKMLRMYPVNATDISEARWVQLLVWTNLGALRRQYPEWFQACSDADLKKLVEWTPTGDQRWYLPDNLRMDDIQRTRQKPKTTEPYDDAALVCVFHQYHVAGPDQPEGAKIVSSGDAFILERSQWIATHGELRRALDLPVDQCKGFDEGVDDAYGMGSMDFLGPGDELLASVDAAWITHFQRFSNRKVFYPLTSALSPKIMQAGMGTYIPIQPGGEPKAEQIPDFPADSLQLRQKIVDNMDDESGLQQTAQGVDSPNVQSGFHAVQVIEQVLAGLSEPRQNCADMIERGYRIQLQLVGEFYTVPQQTKFLGADQDYKLDYWMGSDLGSTTDARILRGTFSMMSPAMKSSIAVSMKDSGVITEYELRRFTIGGTGGMIGLEDDAHWMRMGRQIAAWRKGPPAGWTPPPPMPPPMPAMGADATGAPAAPMPSPMGAPPMGPPSYTPFELMPIDSDPGIAAMRVQELGRAMAGTDFAKADPAWRQVLADAYQQALQASAPPPPPPPPPPAPAIVNYNTLTDQSPSQQSVGQLPPGIATNEGQPDMAPPMPGAPPPAMHHKSIIPLPVGHVPPDAGMAGFDQPPPLGGMKGVSGGPPNLSGVPESPLPAGKAGRFYKDAILK